MTKHFIRQRPFSPPSSAKSAPAPSSAGSELLDLSFLNTVSVFETLRAYSGKFFHLGGHWKRLVWSCEGLGHRLPLPEEEMTAWIYAVLAESGWPDAMMRVSVHWNAPDSGVLVAMTRPFVSHPAEWYRDGVEIGTTVSRRPELKADNPQIKCSQYVGAVLGSLSEPEHRPHELLLLGSGGYAAEGTVSNLFIIKGKRVLTPSAGSGILSGVTRAFVLGLCAARGLEVHETFLTRHEIYTADECFLTNTSSEVLPVVKVDGRSIGTGKPGELTRALGEDFRQNLSST